MMKRSKQLFRQAIVRKLYACDKQRMKILLALCRTTEYVSV